MITRAEIHRLQAENAELKKMEQARDSTLKVLTETCREDGIRIADLREEIAGKQTTINSLVKARKSDAELIDKLQDEIATLKDKLKATKSRKKKTE